ncbi:MAG TPA: DUF1501 domain-containing protein [Bdellovibrionota bacterium]|jgi:uncharacterized protein (DUF1501 family)
MKRRDFLRLSALGLVALPTSWYFAGRAFSASHKLPRRIKSVIVLYMTGGPSQLELFDYKPELIRMHGKTKSGFRTEQNETEGVLMRPIAEFAQRGQSGQWVSDLLPNLANLADELTFIKSVNCTSNNHALGQLDFNTGSTLMGNPFSGSWLNQALGDKPAELPSTVIMADPLGYPRTAPFLWNSGGLSSTVAQLVCKRPADLTNLWGESPSLSMPEMERFLGLARRNASLGGQAADAPLLEARLRALRMSQSTREIFSQLLAQQSSEEEKKLYGLDVELCKNFGQQLLMARKLVEKEVPFVQVFCGNEDDPTSWDHHEDIKQIIEMSRKIDRPIYGLLTDLKRRGLLDSTVILWGGEFGRMPVIQPDFAHPNGRGHNEHVNTIWLAGGGFRKGFSYGETDELSLRTVKDRVEMGDIWATIANQLGIDHHEMRYLEHGVEKRFTKKYHRVMHEILA